MNEEFGKITSHGAYRPHRGGLLLLIIPLAIGFVLGTRKAMMHRGMGPGKRWENGVPPFFAELHRRAHAADQPVETEAV